MLPKHSGTFAPFAEKQSGAFKSAKHEHREATAHLDRHQRPRLRCRSSVDHFRLGVGQVARLVVHVRVHIELASLSRCSLHRIGDDSAQSVCAASFEGSRHKCVGDRTIHAADKSIANGRSENINVTYSSYASLTHSENNTHNLTCTM